ncbi:MAG: hypothetical protein AAF708_18090 [Deinococcota bacterium]
MLNLLRVISSSMRKEVCEYRVSLRGRPVGSYRLTTLAQDKIVLLEAQLDLQGPLGRKSVHQRSSIQRDSKLSLEFAESYRSGSETRNFEVSFDQEEGMVTARRGSRDQASIPYIQAYRDPLSIFYELRQSTSARLQLPLIGKDVVLEHVSDITLETALGPKQALVYSCQPGGNYVYVEDDGSRTILKLSQRLDGQMLEASLVKVSYEAERQHAERHARKGRTNTSQSRQPRAQALATGMGQTTGTGQKRGSQQPSNRGSSSRDAQQDNRETKPRRDSRSRQRSQQRSQRKRADQADKQPSGRNRRSRRQRQGQHQGQSQTVSAGTQSQSGQSLAQQSPSQETEASKQTPQSQTKKRGRTRRGKPPRHANRSRNRTSKPRADSDEAS